MSGDTLVCLIFLMILVSIIWLLRFLSQERFIFNKLMRTKFNSIDWFKFIFLYILIQIGICMNSSLFLMEKIFIPFTIMFAIFSMYMCNSSFDDVKQIKSDPDYDIQRKIWMRNRKIDKIL
jgi:hypothetical protein